MKPPRRQHDQASHVGGFDHRKNVHDRGSHHQADWQGRCAASMLATVARRARSNAPVTTPNPSPPSVIGSKVIRICFL